MQGKVSAGDLIRSAGLSNVSSSGLGSQAGETAL
jgi:hypothetical protein